MPIDQFEMERMQSIHWHEVEYDLPIDSTALRWKINVLPGTRATSLVRCTAKSGSEIHSIDWLRQRTSTRYHTLPSATLIASPLTPLDSSDARNAIISATSCGVATRPGGYNAARSSHT